MGRDREKLHLREVNEGDKMLLYRWANDPTVRNNAFQSKLISLDEHEAWFSSVLQNPDVEIYILTDGKEEIGQVRLNIENGMQIIDYSVEERMRGQGYGTRLLALLETVCNRSKPLVGKVRLDNIASQHVFESLGYECNRTKNCCIYRKVL